MRIVVDLQACQTASRLRGIGRYSIALADALARAPGPHELSFVLNAAFPESVEWIRDRFANLIPATGFHVWSGPTPVAESEPLNRWRTHAAEAMHQAFLRSLRPDAVLLSSLFEGFVDDATTSIAMPSRALGATMLYDLIPLVRSGVLDSPSARSWYERKLESLRRADLLLAISHHAKQEAVSAARLPSERIAVISTAADPCFRPLDPDEAQRRDLSARYAINGPFILYAGGFDERKNVRALVAAYASLAPELRDRYRLVLAGTVDEPQRREFARLAERNRMSPERLVFTGRVEDPDLVLLYNACTLFAFPSLHEGFGLPVLEAMACGAAVIASNATSIPEVMDRTDALFDPVNPDAIAQRLQAALSDERFLAELRHYARDRSAAFSWQTTAQRALDAVAEHWKRKCCPTEACAAGPAQRRVGTTASSPSQRPTLAFVSPLPPERTGVGFYAAELLQSLCAHYRIEIVADQRSVAVGPALADVPVRTFEWFDEHADTYDRTLYQIGNSPFHQRMFELLARHPGTVVMHDLHLGGVLNWMEELAVAPGIFSRWLFESHGFPGLIAERDLGRAAAIDTFPCSWPTIDNAMGIIVHSAHALRLAQHWFRIDREDWREIPQLRRLPPLAERGAARDALGLAPEDVLFCSFGFLDATKLDHRILDAWFASPISADPRCSLVFVGENQGGDYGEQLLRRLAGTARVRITGYVDAETFDHYLLAADAAIQLRGVSRGETSRTVLDCLAHGLPVVVNASASLAELPADAVLGLPAEFDDHALAEALARLAHDAELRLRLAANARRHIANQHDPGRVAVEFHAAIEHFASESAQANYRRVVEDVARIEVEPRADEADWRAAARSIAIDVRRPAARQIFVDVSILERQDLKTGIERVVRAVLGQLLERTVEGFRVEPVVAAHDCYRYARRFTAAWLGIATHFGDDTPIELTSGDVFLGLDWAANVVPDQEWVLQRYRTLGVSITFVVYDLLPLMHPQFYPSGIDAMHAAWLTTVSRVADGVLCISDSVADELMAWLHAHAPDRMSSMKIATFPLGADIEHTVPTRGIPEDAAMLRAEFARRPSVLVVGTVEPRKGHAQVLAAFELLWRQAFDVNLIIVGKQGWMVDQLASQMREHPERNRRLFWFESASDEWLDAVYASADVLLAPSLGEGYGLPLVEAGRHGVPVIARDLPVFREVGGAGTSFFSGNSPGAIATAIVQWKEALDAGKAPHAGIIEWKTWRDSVDALLNVVLHGRWTREWKPSQAAQGRAAPRAIRQIDFSHAWLSPSVAIKGLSGREQWGRWSDADVYPHVEIRFRDPLPAKGSLALTARAFGPNVGEPVRIRIGRHETELRFDAHDSTQVASYALRQAPRSVEIVPPHPISAREVGASSDPRRLGVGLVRLTIRPA